MNNVFLVEPTKMEAVARELDRRLTHNLPIADLLGADPLEEYLKLAFNLGLCTLLDACLKEDDLDSLSTEDFVMSPALAKSIAYFSIHHNDRNFFVEDFLNILIPPTGPIPEEKLAFIDQLLAAGYREVDVEENDYCLYYWGIIGPLVRRHDYERVEILLKNGTDPTRAHAITPMLEAILNNDLRMIDLLFKYSGAAFTEIWPDFGSLFIDEYDDTTDRLKSVTMGTLAHVSRLLHEHDSKWTTTTAFEWLGLGSHVAGDSKVTVWDILTKEHHVTEKNYWSFLWKRFKDYV